MTYEPGQGLGWDVQPEPPRRPRRRRSIATPVVVTLVILAMLGGGGWFAWTQFQPQIDAVLHIGDSADYAGEGTGSVDIAIKSGDIGSNIAETLAQAGVVKTSSVFYTLLLAQSPAPVFQPGVYRLHEQMSSQAALALLLDPSSKVGVKIVIPEGTAEKTILAKASTALGIPLADLQQAAKTSPQSFGLPAQAKTLEGFLFPATYEFDPGTTAAEVISTLVKRAKQSLTADGVAPAAVWNTIVLASIVQKESGPNPADPPKIARVFLNRIANGWPLESDATVAYGTGHTNTVWTTNAERADASNPYNTYRHLGLPIGPIGNPGDAAIKAVLHPAAGTWMFFSVVNLKTGETVFSRTQAEHDAAAAQLRAWCADPANASYCQ
ncbi:endolytic transglycosylase MltG [Gryllotalpicola sp.]|uniref:endolytic transglycosylase MltG n=1 Tax=Gryllotalpicola sp. TaxID=1932787 RepID=UPI0026125124|nr:endolytic transglycosylase MltG [Gryllotalpicola sp.]